MRLSHIALNAGIFVGAALLAVIAAWVSVFSIEQSAQSAIDSRFRLAGVEWAEVHTSGLQVFLKGEAPDEHARFRALTLATEVVTSARVVDQVSVTPAAPIDAPRFSVEILRNDRGISLIGLIPAGSNREALARQISRLARDTPVTDLMETADYPVPQSWEPALAFALEALKELPKSKISVEAGKVTITAITESAEEKHRLESALSRAAPDGLRVAMEISAPRPVITPFTLRFLKDEAGARFDACSAHTEEGRDRIIAAARAVGLEGRATCPLGLGVPSPDWPQAVSAAILAVDEMGGGSVTFSDADLTLVAPETTSQKLFDRVSGELEAALPEVFSLHAVLPEPVSINGTGDAESGPPEFVATLSPEGQVQLRGRLADDRQRSAAESLAQAHFGTAQVYDATRLDEALPAGWSVRVLAALEALSHLSNGAVVVQPDIVDVSGETGGEHASAEISRILSEKLGQSENFRVNVTYVEALDPVAALPTPEECASAIRAVLAENKITFDPGSSDIQSSARATVDRIAEILRTCPDVEMEIAGYTDSQGRESMNQALSQSRAQAVLNALLARRVLTSNLSAVGYGEADPIAGNDSEEGREANRRIEFHLVTHAAAADGAEATHGQEAGAAAQSAPETTGSEGPAGGEGNE